jgi:protein phosphatase 1D
MSSCSSSSRLTNTNPTSTRSNPATNSANTQAGNNNVIVNMRVTANSQQGHRKYMEDCYKIRFQRDTMMARQSSSSLEQQHQQQQQNGDILFSYFGIFDGHGGKEASQYCKEKLYWKIIESDLFWSENDSDVLDAIRNGFMKCQMEMWKELPNWPQTPSGLPSTSGTTATVLFIKKSKAYVGHVGDSGIVIGYTKTPSFDSNSRLNSQWFGKKLTRDHKPEDPVELKRIQSSGGSVMSKSGVNRVVWNRPILANIHNAEEHTGHVTPYELNYLKNKKNVPTERVPFLAVARSLGDLWSYNLMHDEYIVSPEPDVFVFELDPQLHKCLVLATDGLWNVLKPNDCVELVRQTDRETEKMIRKANNETSSKNKAQPFVNPSQRLVNTAIQKCCERMIRADNTSCITIMIDLPPNMTPPLLKSAASNKTLDSCRMSGSDQIESDCEDSFGEEFLEQDDDEDDNYDRMSSTTTSTYSHRQHRQRQKQKLTKTFTGGKSVLEDDQEEFSTPLNNDKRSRSLMSLRRRHWSASSQNTNSRSRSSSVNSAHRQYVNCDDRNKRRLFANGNTNSTTSHHNNKNRNQPMDYDISAIGDCLNKSSSMNSIYNSTAISTSAAANRRNRRMNRSMKSEKPHNRKSLNASTISSTTLVVGLNRLSRNLRKSFNDIYTITTNKLNETRITRANPTQDDLKENRNNNRNSSMANHLSSSSSLPQPIEARNAKEKQQEKESKYSLKLKKFKNRILQTTNTLFNRKKKPVSPINSKITALSRRKSISSPHILNNTTRSVIDRRRHNNPTNLQRKFDLDDIDFDNDKDQAETDPNEYERTYNQNEDQEEGEEIENDDEDNYLRTDAVSVGVPSSNRLNETNQSFVNSVKNYLKRNRSQKIIDSNNELKQQHQHHQQQQQQHHQHMQQQIQQQQEQESNMKRFNHITNNLNKRPKFY